MMDASLLLGHPTARRFFATLQNDMGNLQQRLDGVRPRCPGLTRRYLGQVQSVLLEFDENRYPLLVQIWSARRITPSRSLAFAHLPRLTVSGPLS